ncbi:unnamed protein product [Mytilus edulis]|uniref:Core-binding (CB) domain-containing protein n=1 Tax=Mytilus edulis TaxID=6550 RepID=A0A8S3SXJ5_MYTED|nr:unnamed protein product [Mytilus edulis]
MIAPLHVRGHLVFYDFVLEAARRHFVISREKANSVNLRSFPIAEDDFKFGKECWELQTSFTRNREFGWYNLGFDGTEIQVEFASLGGGNYPDKLARDIVSFADYVITVYGVSHVVIGQLLPRYSGSSGHDYNEKMPTQRSRVRRRVAPTDLRDVDPVPVIPDIVAPQPRRRKRARADTTQVPADRPVQPVQQPAESIPQIPVTHPSADQIAAAMISQLKDSGVQLTVNREPVTTNFLTNYLTDGVSHDNTGRRDLTNNAEPIQIAESGPNSSYVLAPPLVTDPDVLAYTGQDTVEGSSQALGIDNSAMGKTATYILQNTLPLGFNVDEKIRRDIWSDLYLDLIKLLPNFNEEENDDILFRSPSNCSLVKSKSSYGSTASLESVTAQLLQASLSHSTRQSYKRMLNVFQQFCKEKFPVVQPFPSTSIMIAHFISFLFLKNYQPSTIASYISAISFVHKLNFWSDPTDSFFIKKIIKGAQNLRSSSDNRLPITKEILSKLVAAIPVVVQSPTIKFC